jgi:cell division protein FtsZ
MTLNLTIPQHNHTDFSPRITVIGVGGGGTNAVDNMIAMNLQGVEFVVANTDAQQLVHSRADRRIQLGPHLTSGLGAGAKPDVGRAAAEEAADELYRHLDGAHMVFITAGMGGGTGTGAAPVIARMARERGILTVGVVTKPFTFEGGKRARSAEEGITELQQYVDTLIVIPNQNLFRLANERTGFREAFKMADNVLYMGVRGVTDLMMAPGLVNLDFADIRAVMAEMGKAMMGTGEADGENRAIRAAEHAISNPLLEDTSMSGARGLLINITGGEDMTLFEVDQAANRIREEVDEDANIIFGAATDDSLEGRIRVSVVATGIESAVLKSEERPRLVAVGGMQGVHAVSSQSHSGPQAGGGGADAGNAASPLSLVGGAPNVMRAPGQAPRMQPPMSRSMQPSAAQGQGMHGVAPQAPHGLQPPAREAEAAAYGASQAGAPQVGAPHVGAYVPALDETPAGPRVIPAHLQQPLKPQAARPVRPSARPAPGLFNDPGRTGTETPNPSPPRKTLFGIVTGVFRPSAAPASSPDAPRAPAHAYALAEPMQNNYGAEPVIAEVQPDHGGRHGGQDERDLDIPTFLRRQTSNQSGS